MYKLNLKFVDGSQQIVELSQVHRLVPDSVRPHALVYTDGNNLMHNIPFTALLDFWFSTEEYNKLEKEMLNSKPNA